MRMKSCFFAGRQNGAAPETPAERRESGSPPTVLNCDCTVCKYIQIMTCSTLDAYGHVIYYLKSLHMCYYILNYLMETERTAEGNGCLEL